MEITYSYLQIEEFMQEHKVLPNNWRNQLYKDEELFVVGSYDNKFGIKIRQSSVYPLDFSAILTVSVPLSSTEFRLRRYNGSTNPHPNPIEGNVVNEFHIHYATERYQRRGDDEETYAEETSRFSDLDGALRCLLKDANFEEPPQLQLHML